MKSLLVTGGTGSFGQAFIRRQLDLGGYERLIVFSRDELKQHQMRVGGLNDPRLRYFIGDVRDRDRLRRALHGVDVVVHAAALKQVDSCEFNPLEAVRTNVDGTANVIDACLDAGVARMLLLGTDKAVDPVNLYGATKLVAEKLVVDANHYAGGKGTRFAATRYGNVLGSRGSVLPVFLARVAAGEALPVTDPVATRFVLTLEQGVTFVTRAIDEMGGGEVLVPKLPAVDVATIAESVGSGWVLAGLRPGEKLHERLISGHEAPRTVDRGWCYCVLPTWEPIRGNPVEAGFEYVSDQAERLSVGAFRRLASLDGSLEMVPGCL